MLHKISNILITGASSGIGEALALHYAKNDAKNLFISGRNKQRLQEVCQKCQELGANVYPKIIDVADKENMYKWIRECNDIVLLIVAKVSIWFYVTFIKYFKQCQQGCFL